MNNNRRLEAWQACRALARAVYIVTRTFPPDERFGLISQMRRAAVSSAANIAEGWARSGAKETAHALSIALGSLAELDALFVIADDQGLLTPEQLVTLETHRSRASRLTYGLNRKLRQPAARHV